MSYRRKNETVTDLYLFKAFCQNNLGLLAKIGFPSFVVENFDYFNYFLMHGALWPNAPVKFNLDELSDEIRQDYLLLLNRYFEAGLSNPGLAGLTQEEVDQLKSK